MPVFIGPNAVEVLPADKQRFLQTGRNKRKVVLFFWFYFLEDVRIYCLSSKVL
jgi:hypothetical protein